MSTSTAPISEVISNASTIPEAESPRILSESEAANARDCAGLAVHHYQPQ
jgi:hypothetical protein